MDDDFSVFEDFLGLYHLTATDAENTAIKDVLLQLQVPLSKLRGQCYDGCGTMAGRKAGVATLIEQEEEAPFSNIVTCSHALKLSVK